MRRLLLGHAAIAALVAGAVPAFAADAAPSGADGASGEAGAPGQAGLPGEPGEPGKRSADGAAGRSGAPAAGTTSTGSDPEVRAVAPPVARSTPETSPVGRTGAGVSLKLQSVEAEPTAAIEPGPEPGPILGTESSTGAELTPDPAQPSSNKGLMAAQYLLTILGLAAAASVLVPTKTISRLSGAGPGDRSGRSRRAVRG